MTRQIRGALSNLYMGMRLSIIDRGLLIADFVIATVTPYIIQYLIWTSVYMASKSDLVAGFAKIDLMFYYGYAIALSRLNNGYDVIEKLAQDVNEATIEPELLKPLPYPVQKLCLFMGEGFLYTIPLFLIVAIQFLYGGIQPGNAVEVVQFIFLLFVILMASQLLCFLTSFLIALAGFWFKKPDATLALMTMLPAFLGGALLPPSFWPGFIRPVMTYNPFAFVIAGPAKALASFNIAELTTVIQGTVVYIAIFVIAVSLVWRLALSSYEGAGG